jgi:FOG: WD40-like repeat
VNKFLNFFLFLILFLVTSRSFDKKTGFWTKTKKITEAEKIEYKIKEVFVEEKAIEKELNPDLKINLSAKLINKSFINNFDNNNGRVNYNGILKNISRYKFAKIEDFNEFEPEIVFDKDNVIFFDNKGTILKFSNSSKLLWKKNYYSKSEKKLNPILFLARNNNTLIVADHVSKYYAIDINSGELLWTKNNSSPFNSQVKIFKDKFFVIDFENVLKCFSLKNG